ncbi:TonB-dependent receptor [Sphingomonas sp. dw_22]|uniref:TonB-dependent receptor n=1 Tax=Sphingomonas sp. dw_22 TaxID=2721175 RepID=UPI001BD6C96D|nr:TonB-dependent receptor [Sphingomonas sp. dw_22]
MKFAKSRYLAGAALGACFFSTAAFAQDAQTSADSGTDLNEIVVTAERRPENQQDVPVSVAVISGQNARDFTASGDDTLLALSGKVPSFYAETTTGRIFPRFYIRGLGNIDFYLGASQPVSIIQDDVVLEHVVLKSNPVYDLDHVEVLRGPQGSLFGRNTTAGIVKFDTVRPSQELSGQAQLSYGSYNSINLDAGIGGPLSDNVAVRISGLFQHRDDYVDNRFAGPNSDGTKGGKNVMGGFDERDVRFQVLATPTADWSVLGSFHVRNYNGTSTLFLRNALVKGSNDVSNVSRTSVNYDEAANNPQDYNTYGGSLNSTWDFGGVTLTSVTAYETSNGYSRGDTDGGVSQLGYVPTLAACRDCGESMGRLRDLDQWTQELRLASDTAGPFKWQLGGMYFDQRDITEFYQRAWFLSPGVVGRNPNNWVRLHDVNTSWAFFGQASYQVLPKLTLTAGARITQDTKTTDLLKTADTAAGAVTYTGRHHVRLSDTKPSWDVSALYEVSPDVSVYARVAKGFRGPTVQGRSAVFNSDFTTANSETILSWEAGFKSTIGRTLRFNASAFTYTVDDIQLNGNDADGNGVLFNADKAKAYGAEAELDWHPVRNLAISLGASYLHTEIQDKRVYAQVCTLNGVVVCTVKDPVIQRTVFGAPAYFAQIDGNPLPNAPKYNLNLAARYDIPVFEKGKIFISTDWNVQGYTNYVLYKTDEFYSDGNIEGGLKIGYSGNDGAYELAVFARNITNEKNLKGVIENYMAAVINDPRIIGVSLTGRIK